jgi:hypothetical protein
MQHIEYGNPSVEFFPVSKIDVAIEPFRTAANTCRD